MKYEIYEDTDGLTLEVFTTISKEKEEELQDTLATSEISLLVKENSLEFAYYVEYGKN